MRFALAHHDRVDRQLGLARPRAHRFDGRQQLAEPLGRAQGHDGGAPGLGADQRPAVADLDPAGDLPDRVRHQLGRLERDLNLDLRPNRSRHLSHLALDRVSASSERAQRMTRRLASRRRRFRASRILRFRFTEGFS